MSTRRFMLLTLAFLLALLFMYSRKTFRVFSIEISGSGDFRREVEEGLREGGLRFEVSREAGIVFSQGDKTVRIGDEVYHLDWSDSVLRRIRAEAIRMGLGDYELVPQVGWVGVFKEVASLIKSGFSSAFQNSYLVVPVSVVASGVEVMVYDPLRDTFIYRGR